MRRMVLLSLFAILVTDACAQRRGGMGAGVGRGGFGLSRGRYAIPYGYGYRYEPYAAGTPYAYAPQPMLLVLPPPPPAIVEAPPREVHPVVIDYKPPAPVPAAASSAPAVRQTTYLPKLLNGNGLSGPPMAPLCAMFTDDGDVI
jgi:hypothetical protein